MLTNKFIIFLAYCALVSCLDIKANVTNITQSTPSPEKQSTPLAKDFTSLAIAPKANVSLNMTEPAIGEAKENTPEGTVSLFSWFGRKSAIGDSCKTNEECKIKEAFCINGTCQCSTEYVPSGNKNSCLIRPRQLLDNCIEDLQCETGLNATGLVSCISFKCICSLDAYIVEGKCYKRLVLGNECQLNQECSVPLSRCIQNICTCDTRMEPDVDNTKCIAIKALDVTTVNCSDSNACGLYGDLYHCQQGVCACKPGYHFSGSECVPELKLGEYCKRPSDCLVDTRAEKPSLRTCINGVCSCIKGYRGTSYDNLCRSGATIIRTSLALLVLLNMVIFTLCKYI